MEATYSQKLEDWVMSHARCFQFLGGVPELIIPDNLKSAVTKTCRYEPDLNPTYQQLATHYDTVIVPARPYKPKDKAKAEVGVQIVERWIMARLRNETFFSLRQLNLKIQALLVDLNQRQMKKHPGSRLSQFEAIDKPALKPLPTQAYSYTLVKQVSVHIDYHVEVEKHYYSVPHTLIKQKLEAHATGKLVTLYHKGIQVAVHPRSHRQGAHTTLDLHMPIAHQKQQQWTPQRFERWAAKFGASTEQFVMQLMQAKKHPEQSYRACMGLLRLGKKFTEQRLEAACYRALATGVTRVKQVKTMQNLNQQVNSQLSNLKLSGIRDALLQQYEQPNLYVEQSFEERLSLLLEHEITQRDQRKIDRLTRQAKFRVGGTLSQLNYGAERQLDKTQIRSLAQGEWLRFHQNILITGATGCGKTYLACALGHNHCQQGVSVYYFRLKELLEKMFLAQADGSYRKLINKLSSASLLILDDWELEPLTAQQRSDLLELIDARYDTKSTLIASQLPIENWYEMIGESTHADAILDRLVHRAIKLELKGESMRKKLNSLTDADHSS